MQLLMSICLIAAPTQCRNERVIVAYEPVGPVMCMVTAQQSIARWQGTHPKWRVMKWKCQARLPTVERLI
ncbi:MAG: hypothetical protein E5Y10_23455 [Mesorhizobium sp.]|nr:MAG: hypothetical protein EOS06_25160 [Mesorhizobium sp.]RWO47674.1 MAG: hypothetical protein EOS13_25415 [Mesorhizobium sp.]RWO76893.1 MAG: hypothetical protein EOS18_23825 [Mesorhizobium sp.]TIN23701.1 MAG: hypothetical protein E5Y19_25905 [Mesorhizobium sp.]TIN36334.1 MAG: hypothetical protein E5Y13_24615 [Mesorhizobium sp.]